MNKILFFVTMTIVSCQISTSKPKLTMTNDQLVEAMIELYTAKAAANLSNVEYRDSLMDLYYVQIAKKMGKPVQEIESNFNELLKVPDSLVMIQNRAMDTIREWQNLRLSGGKKTVTDTLVNKDVPK